VCAFLLALLATGGCSPLKCLRDQIAYNHHVNELVTSSHNRRLAKRAWKQRRSEFCDQPQFRDFGAGFGAGYCDVASGGHGCPPPLPPRKYWKSRYEDYLGQERVAAWFAGYPHGARAAEEDGVGAWRSIQLSPAVQQQYLRSGIREVWAPQSSDVPTDAAPVDSATAPIDEPDGHFIPELLPTPDGGTDPDSHEGAMRLDGSPYSVRIVGPSVSTETQTESSRPTFSELGHNR